jgi:acetylornithine deacetylase/succinyl-diaminopimelate desuccinylase-like protein
MPALLLKRRSPGRRRVTLGCASTRSRSSGGAANSPLAVCRRRATCWRAMRDAHAVAAGQDGRPPDVWGAPYGSDLRLLTGLGGIPTLHYGPGDAGLAHGPNESVPLAAVELAAGVLAALALDITSAG